MSLPPHARTVRRRLVLSALLALTAPASVRAAERVEFVRDVMPVLTKAGCNGGACHGSFQGRGGFALSLLGFDPFADYDALARAGRGRRLHAGNPTQSLLLRKATGAMAHGGGRRLIPDTPDYQVL